MKVILSSLVLVMFMGLGVAAQAPTPTPTPAPTPKPATADIAGSWSIAADAQGQIIDITMDLKQTGDTFTGTTTSQIGNGTVTNGKITGKSFSGTLSSDVQGQAMEFVIEGTVDGDTVKGTFANPALGSVPFTGKRAAKKTD